MNFKKISYFPYFDMLGVFLHKEMVALKLLKQRSLFLIKIQFS